MHPTHTFNYSLTSISQKLGHQPNPALSLPLSSVLVKSRPTHCLFSVKLRHVPPAVCHLFWGHSGQRHSHIAAILNMWHHSKINWQQLWPHDLPQLSGIIHLSVCCCKNTHTWSENWDILSYVSSNVVLKKCFINPLRIREQVLKICITMEN